MYHWRTDLIGLKNLTTAPLWSAVSFFEELSNPAQPPGFIKPYVAIVTLCFKGPGSKAKKEWSKIGGATEFGPPSWMDISSGRPLPEVPEILITGGFSVFEILHQLNPPT